MLKGELKVEPVINSNVSSVNGRLQPAQGTVSVGDWMVTLLLLAIPVVNIIMLFVWAFGDGTNQTKANYAKAALVWAGIGLVLSIISAILFWGLMAAFFATISGSGGY